MTVKAESFHLNGQIIRFRPPAQKLESPYKTPSRTLAVKGLRRSKKVHATRLTGLSDHEWYIQGGVLNQFEWLSLSLASLYVLDSIRKGQESAEELWKA